MKIIQTLWLPNSTDPVKNQCGWLSPEYHWLSWTLSVLQLKQFYSEVELYANEAARHVLIDLLKLPYTKVQAITNDDIPPGAWALSKIHTYRHQQEPFLHVDGDVFIWKAFDQRLLSSALITQNQEVGFDTYAPTLKIVNDQFAYIPDLIKEFSNQEVPAYNAGIFGGSDLDFFKTYSQEAIEFVTKNKQQFIDTPYATALCMLFEQWFFGAMTLKHQKQVSTFLPEPVTDNTYPGMADFLDAKARGYLHMMGISKKNRYMLKQMMSKVRQEYPEEYYRVLKMCRDHGVELDFKVYQLPEMDPMLHHPSHYRNIIKNYLPTSATALNGNKWAHYYGKDAFAFRQAEKFHAMTNDDMQQQVLYINKDIDIIDEEEASSQLLRVQDTFTLTTVDINLDDLEMIMLDALQTKSQSISELLNSISHHFDEGDFEENKNMLAGLMIDKVKKLVYQGIIAVSD